MTPAVSVVLPTYQRRELVQRALASAVTQTFRDFELLVVDDGSTDGTDASLAERGDIIYIRQDHQGVAAARNTGVEHARAPVIAFLDSDDRWRPEHLSVLLALLAAHPAAVLASTSPKHRAGTRQPMRRPRLVDPFPKILICGLAGFSSSVAVRRIALLEAGGFDEELPGAEDTDLWLRLALGGQFVLQPRRTFVIGRSQDSLSKRGDHTGATLDAFILSRGKVAEQLEAAADSRAGAVRGALAYVEALRNLEHERWDAVRGSLHNACAWLPALSSVQAIGTGLYLAGLLPGNEDPMVCARRLRFLSRAWPAQGSAMQLALWVRSGLASRMAPPTRGLGGRR